MKKVFVLVVVMMFTCTAFAGPRCGGGNSGIGLAAQIVGLVKNAVTPSVVVAPPVPYGPPAYAVPQVIPPAPVYTAPPIVVAPVTNVYPYPAGYGYPVAPVATPVVAGYGYGYGYGCPPPPPCGPGFRGR